MLRFIVYETQAIGDEGGVMILEKQRFYRNFAYPLAPEYHQQSMKTILDHRLAANHLKLDRRDHFVSL